MTTKVIANFEDIAAATTGALILAALLTVDGAGSLLDADLLDGQEGAYYLPAADYTAADVLAKLLTVDGAGSGLDADLLDGNSSAFYLAASSYTAADVLAKLLTVDGAGSGLDADLLDGNSSAFYLPASSYTAADVLAKLLTVDGAGSGLDADLLDGQSSAAFQAASARLAEIAALAVTDGNIIVGNGSAWVAESGATARTSLGLGTGDTVQFTALNIGHASDTSLSRVSAGDLQIEANIIYRAGGTNVAIADGGHGQDTANAGFNALAPTSTRGDMIRRGASANERFALGTALALLKSDGTDAVWGTAGQIAFPATQAASADANTLDDYEEGTFTPTYSAATPPTSVTYSAQDGYYTKIGNQVLYTWRFVLTSEGSGGAGTVRLGGLPFTSANITPGWAATLQFTEVNLTAGYTQAIALVQPNTDYAFTAQQGDDVAVSSLAWGVFASGANSILSAAGHYHV